VNDPDPVPSNFGFRYITWVVWRWVYFNPLTIVMTVQAILFQLALDNPAVHWLGTGASIAGIIVAQIRNKDKDYTIPIAQSKVDQAKATIVANPPPIKQDKV
jgi:hypothetical protein